MKTLKFNFHELASEAVIAVSQQDFERAHDLLTEIERVSKVVVSNLQEHHRDSLPE